MRALLIMLLSVMLAFQAHADAMARNGNVTVFITDKGCEYRLVLAQIKPEFHHVWYAASATVDGKAYMACWALIGDTVVLVYEDGDRGEVPIADFKRIPSV